LAFILIKIINYNSTIFVEKSGDDQIPIDLLIEKMEKLLLINNYIHSHMQDMVNMSHTDQCDGLEKNVISLFVSVFFACSGHGQCVEID
jgi:hypothetical protein